MRPERQASEKEAERKDGQPPISYRPFLACQAISYGAPFFQPARILGAYVVRARHGNTRLRGLRPTVLRTDLGWRQGVHLVLLFTPALFARDAVGELVEAFISYYCLRPPLAFCGHNPPATMSPG